MNSLVPEITFHVIPFFTTKRVMIKGPSEKIVAIARLAATKFRISLKAPFFEDCKTG